MGVIGPGDWVECVDVSPRDDAGPSNLLHLSYLRLGEMYLVSFAGHSRTGMPIVRLRGVQQVPPAEGFRPERFRPIYRPKSELIEDLKRRAKEPLRVSEVERAATPAPDTSKPAQAPAGEASRAPEA